MTKLLKVNYEIKCNRQQVIVTRTDTEGNIVYCNPTFLEVNDFKSAEVIHQPHSIVRHPDMPKTIFHIIWSIISQGMPIQAVIKNQTNRGEYYWTLMTIKPQFDRDHNIISYVAYGKQAPDSVIKTMNELYNILYEIEIEHDIESALEYLESYLREKEMTYAEYMKFLTKNRQFKCLCDFIKYKILH
jgi:PAS domain S-box-containing protein